MNMTHGEWNKSICERLIALRVRNRLSINAAAKKIGMTSASAVWAWEQGTYVPNAWSMRKIAEAYGVSLDWLMGKEPISQSHNVVVLVLSRRNLETLTTKLDTVREGGQSMCTVIKHDQVGQANGKDIKTSVAVTAVEDAIVYKDRPPGEMIEDRR